MLEPVKYKQGSYTFYITRYDPFEAMRVLGNLQKILGPVFGGALKSASLDSELTQAKDILPMLGGALTELPTKLSGDQFVALCRMLLRPDYISVSNAETEKISKLTEPVINDVFEGRPLDMLALMFQVVKVNYLDFSKLLAVPAGVREALNTMTRNFLAS